MLPSCALVGVHTGADGSRAATFPGASSVCTAPRPRSCPELLVVSPSRVLAYAPMALVRMRHEESQLSPRAFTRKRSCASCRDPPNQTERRCVVGGNTCHAPETCVSPCLWFAAIFVPQFRRGVGLAVARPRSSRPPPRCRTMRTTPSSPRSLARRPRSPCRPSGGACFESALRKEDGGGGLQYRSDGPVS